MLRFAPRFGWVILLLGAALLVGWWMVVQVTRGNPRLRFRLLGERLRRLLRLDAPLCRTCKWNDPRDCRHRTRPYAKVCEDYRRR